MLKEWKNKRQLSLLVAFALSAGGTLFSDLKYISAADVTGGDVTIDSSTPTPYPNPLAGGYIPPAGNGNVTNNTLTLDGVALDSGTVYGGYNKAPTGDATENTVVLRNASVFLHWGNAYIYGGYSTGGNATGNKVVLIKSANNDNIYGGKSDHTGADETTGNTLVMKSKDNSALYL